MRSPIKSNSNSGIISWPHVAIILGLGLLITIGIAITARRSAFRIIVKGSGQEVVFSFDEDKVDFNDLLDKILSEEDRKTRLVQYVLRSHNFYYVPSVEVATAISKIEETEETYNFIHALRKLLYNLEGPFSRPKTFVEAGDDRIISAFEDLYIEKPSSPLIAKLWEMSLEWQSLFAPREIKVFIRKDETLEKSTASACIGSLLLNKSALILTTSKEKFVEVSVNQTQPCQSASPERLLAGEKINIGLSKDCHFPRIEMSKVEISRKSV